jgi:hypothetical protein
LYLNAQATHVIEQCSYLLYYAFSERSWNVDILWAKLNDLFYK